MSHSFNYPTLVNQEAVILPLKKINNFFLTKPLLEGFWVIHKIKGAKPDQAQDEAVRLKQEVSALTLLTCA